MAKKPILLKNALPNFPSPIAPDEVAGLAMESFIDSRVITNSDNNWKVAQGPFEDFSQFGERCWSLLVQGVDNWFDSVDELKSMVNFIPKWRIDDVMISFSTHRRRGWSPL
ncbi:cupin domain-containing protein [Psychrosphaera algicola]|uniref:Cupin domain-containing protein n=1 Tax=Psychrosphaera algicola TaxID=3023714 RepID=A0ABT5F9C7_9GAMM|nr:cupin domain-containing protein [Psychrosphaera sp. G1-22]MDC2888138.1 cupin domain-containing protein [Psychrosphaera sp. G1-22]